MERGRLGQRLGPSFWATALHWTAHACSHSGVNVKLRIANIETKSSGGDAVPRDPDLHIKVVALSGSGFDLSEELRLVKAALLYADRVTLVAPKVVYLASFAQYLDLAPDDRVELILEGLSSASPDTGLGVEAFRALKRKRHRSRDEMLTMMKTEAQLNMSAREVAVRISSMLDQPSVEQLARAMEDGALELDPLGAGATPESYDIERMVSQLADVVGDILAPRIAVAPIVR